MTPEARKEKLKADKAAEYVRNRETYRANGRANYQAHKEQRKAWQAAYNMANRDKRAAQKREYYHSTRGKKTKAMWYARNKKRIADHARERLRTDLGFRMKTKLRARVWAALKGKNKAASNSEMLGCTVDVLMAYLAAQFKPGMSWDNHGDWEVDHIRPCASFDLMDPEQQRICFHYSNLQPLWKHENRRKGANWSGQMSLTI